MKFASLVRSPTQSVLLAALFAASACDGAKVIDVTPHIVVNPAKELDFGTVAVGSLAQKPISITNMGEAPLNISKIQVVTSDGFSVPVSQQLTNNCTGEPRKGTFSQLDSGECATFTVEFEPKTPEQSSAQVIIFSNDLKTPSYPVTLTGLGSSVPTCGSGNSPVAHITATDSSGPLGASVLPLTTVKFSAASSTGNITKYAWKLLAAPTNFQWSISGASGQTASLYSALTGSYEVQLTVTTAENCTATTTLNYAVSPGAGIHVELTWDQSFGDLDLHYIGPGGTIFDNETYQGGTPKYPDDGDVFWIYSKQSYCATDDLGDQAMSAPPAWGLNNTIQGPGNGAASLDVDQRCGNGPENITQAHPFDANFEVMVHEYCSGGSNDTNEEEASSGNAPITAVIKVYFNGSMIWSGSQALTNNKVWDAATITVSGSGASATVAAGAGGVTKGPATEGCGASILGGLSHRHHAKASRDDR